MKDMLIDLRMIGQTGIGTAAQFFVHELARRPEAERIRALVHEHDFELLERIVGSDSRLHNVALNARPFSLREQIDRRPYRNVSTHFFNLNHPLRLRGGHSTTVHDVLFLDHPELIGHPLKWKAYEALVADCIRRHDKIFVPSAFTAASLKRHFSTKFCVTIPWGFPDFNVRSGWLPVGALRSEVKSFLASKTRYIFALGNMKPHKNFPWLIRSLNEYATHSGRGVHVVLTGNIVNLRSRIDGLTLEEIQRNPNITFFEGLNHREIRAIFEGADLVTVPSLYEGFSFVPLEALDSGVLPLVSDIPPHRELFGNEGAYFDPTSAETLFARIDESFADEVNRRAWAKELRNSSRRKFSWKNTVDRYLAEYP